MAEAPTPAPAPRRDEKPPATGGGGLKSNSQAFMEIGTIVLVLIIGENLFTRLFGDGGASFWNSSLVLTIEFYYARFKVVSVLVSVILGFAVAYLIRHIDAIRAEERKALYPEPKEDSPDKVVNYKWQRIIDHLESDNVSDWKLAIIEADIILGEMLEKMGYHGDTIGEKLKQVERSDFTTINKAWEAHKIRNLIAHEGANFELTRKEAFRVIGMFKEVFEEFFFI
jgi:hypothetical protein